MTVAELIAALQQFDLAAPVVTGGFDEWGWSNISEPELVTLVAVAPASHGPDFEEPGPRTAATGDPFVAVAIDR